ncbi:MAG: hypothetical protein KJ792_07760 [Actinobacteria bacterium]|nr:hypothetical protein [Actinomycetota bacterium]MCG2801165.1 hypothetical protein [Cellulomonas sp.]
MLGRSFLTALVTCTALVVTAPLAATAADPAQGAARGAPTAHIDAAPGPGWWSASAWLVAWHHHRGTTTPAPVPPPVPTPDPTTAPAGAAGITVAVTIPEAFTITVLHQERTAGRCEVLVAVTDTRLSHPGFVVNVDGGGRGTLVAEQVPGNGMPAAEMRVGRTWAAYPAGRSGGSVRLRGTFATCPSWLLL